MIAFARVHKDKVAIAVALRCVSQFHPTPGLPLDSATFGDTVLRLPAGWKGSWTERLSGRQVEINESLPLREVLGVMPIGVVVSWERGG